MSFFSSHLLDNSFPNYGFSIDDSSSNRNGHGVIGNSWLGGCGVGFIKQISYCSSFHGWETKASFFSALYTALAAPGNFLYQITDDQFDTPVHKGLLSIGSKEIAAFPNLYHSPATIHVFHCNIRNAVNVYCDVYGDPLPFEPVGPPAMQHHKPPKNHNYFTIPKRPKNEQRPIAQPVP
jgi:hypothetical protein